MVARGLLSQILLWLPSLPLVLMETEHVIQASDITRLRCVPALLLLIGTTILFTGSSHAFDAPVAIEPVQLPDSKGYVPILMGDLPPFMADCETKVTKSGKVPCHGLMATINYTEFKKKEPSIKEEQLILQPSDTGFQKEVPIRLIRQNGKAPLAVVLLGFGQKSDDKLARAWQTYLCDAGCHVLIFDSLVRNNMNEATNIGVAGNFVEETKAACKIVDASLALKLSDGKTLRDYSTSVRVMGTSYGGLLAAQMLRSSQAKEWPLDRVLILSTPINMRTAAQRLDTFSREDQPFFGIFELAKLLGGYTPKSEHPSPREERLMRAGIGYVFHGDLQGLAKSNMERYDPTLPERLKGREENKEQKAIYTEMVETLKQRQKAEMKEVESKKDTLDKDAYQKLKTETEERHRVQEIIAKRQPSQIDHWNFYDYVFLLLKPYWKLKHGDSSAVTLEQMLRGAPNFVQSFVAADDPLNDPKELEAMQARLEPPALQVMPHGGHLGYTATKWVEVLIHKMFEPGSAGAPTAPPPLTRNEGPN